MSRTDISLAVAGLLVFVLVTLGSIRFIGNAIEKATEERRQELVDYGKKSRAAGLPATANPFKSMEGKWWLDGWVESQKTQGVPTE